MNKETKVLIIGSPMVARDIAVAAKVLKEQTTLTLAECAKSFQEASNQLTLISEKNKKSFHDLEMAILKLKASQIMPKGKSKYINKPLNNFKQRGYKNRHR